MAREARLFPRLETSFCRKPGESLGNEGYRRAKRASFRVLDTLFAETFENPLEVKVFGARSAPDSWGFGRPLRAARAQPAEPPDVKSKRGGGEGVWAAAVEN